MIKINTHFIDTSFPTDSHGFLHVDRCDNVGVWSEWSGKNSCGVSDANRVVLLNHRDGTYGREELQ